MAKITITIEDMSGAQEGFARCTSNPSFEEMMKIAERRNVTPAQAFALHALTAIRERARQNNSPIQLPKARRIM